MYACLHVTAQAGGAARTADLLDLALEFSPSVEQTAADTVVFSIAPLQRLFGTPHRIASEIGRYGNERKLLASLGVANNPDTAVLVARNYSGVTFVAAGEEPERLAALPLTALFTHDLPVDPALLDLLERWGVKTCGDLAALPERGVAERLGAAGLYLRDLALGRANRPLRLQGEETRYEERVELEDAVETLEPLLFLFARTLGDLCGRLRSQSRAARLLETRLLVEERETGRRREFVCSLEFPVPLDESRTMLKLLQLHLERHGPEAPVVGFALRVEAVAPRRVQGGLFLPPAPAPDKLQVTMARLTGMVGEEYAGTPELLNTHRPGAFRMRAPAPTPVKEVPAQSSNDNQVLRLAIRIFRPALHARVRLVGVAPKQVVAPGVEGGVVQAAGPWRTSGDWWTEAPWARDEWDVELEDGALYRIYRESRTREWYVQGMYD